MSSTAAVTVTQAWQSVSTGSNSVTVQFRGGQAPVYVYVGPSEPGANDRTGVSLSDEPGRERAFQAFGLTETDNVYLCTDAAATAHVVVLKS